MRIPVKLFGFVFWLFSLNCAQCQECLQKDITYENIEPDAKASYSDGETVRVKCMTGYTGLYKLNCENGKWKTVVERPCAKKKCSQPGDIANGDFKLIKGSEFVFGATVLYTCKKGFEMTSRINQRTCRSEGWDNTLPVCEAVKCPAIRTDGGVTASGNTDEGSYGDLIHFECVSTDKKIDGSSDIHCTETGEWSDSVPTCKEITCAAPVIQDGYVVEEMQKYQKDARLKYECFKGFKPREGIPKCSKFGWTLKPECDEVTCELKSTTYGVEKITPEGKTIFRAGERVEITCAEKYWISFTKEITKSFKCQDDGKWDMEPVCREVTCELKSTTYGVEKIKPRGKTIFRAGERVEITCAEKYWIFFTKEITKSFKCKDDGKWDNEPFCQDIKCEVPHDQDVFRPNFYFSGDMKFGAKQYYSCISGYDQMAAEATCTRDGWTPKPLCVEKMCAAPNIANAKIVGEQRPKYKISSKIQYKCNPGFEPEQPVQITCNSQTEWTGILQCTEKCGLPPKVDFADTTKMTKNEYNSGEKVEYSCFYKYTLDQHHPYSKYLTCEQGQWRGNIRCLKVTCELKSTTYGVEKIKPEDKAIFRAGERVEITCAEKYWISFTKEITKSFKCQDDGKWDNEPVCQDIKCEVPHDQDVFRPNFYFSGDMKFGAKQNYSCISGYDQMAAEATCTRDGWTPKPLCVEKCGLPPKVDFADTTNMTKNEYNSGEKVEYSCFYKYTLDQHHPYSKYLTCEQGQWRGNIRCLKPCSVTVEEMDKRGIRLRWGKQENKISTHEDQIGFECQTGKNVKGNVNDLRQTCNDGVMNLPQCV
ncbi:hypothetical protein PO909_013071 [Leuciscus waleckii]